MRTLTIAKSEITAIPLHLAVRKHPQIKNAYTVNYDIANPKNKKLATFWRWSDSGNIAFINNQYYLGIWIHDYPYRSRRIIKGHSVKPRFEVIYKVKLLD